MNRDFQKKTAIYLNIINLVVKLFLCIICTKMKCM